MLRATLRVTVDSDVTFTLDVENTGPAPMVLHFARAQQYDFIVSPLSGSAPVWRWSADRGFAEMLTTRTLAPGEHWIITEHWRPAGAGHFVAQALITSTSHPVTTSATLSIP